MIAATAELNYSYVPGFPVTHDDARSVRSVPGTKSGNSATIASRSSPLGEEGIIVEYAARSTAVDALRTSSTLDALAKTAWCEFATSKEHFILAMTRRKGYFARGRIRSQQPAQSCRQQPA
ncbi:hypothetical protein Q5752_006424 [Cryptotrichosporon argae]